GPFFAACSAATFEGGTVASGRAAVGDACCSWRFGRPKRTSAATRQATTRAATRSRRAKPPLSCIRLAWIMLRGSAAGGPEGRGLLFDPGDHLVLRRAAVEPAQLLDPRGAGHVHLD